MASWNVSLNAAQSKLFKLSPANTNQASLQWSPNSNSGVWDVENSVNWINTSNQSSTIFNNGDNVLFDDIPRVCLTTVNVNGTVAPGLITVNSSTNYFTIQSGTISGAGGLVKEGSSLLTIYCAGNFTGPVTIGGGTVYAGNNSFASVSSITISNNSTLDLGWRHLLSGGTPVTVSGSWISMAKEQSITVTIATSRWNCWISRLPEIRLSARDSTVGFGERLATNQRAALISPMDWSADHWTILYGEWNSVTIGANVQSITLTNGSGLGVKDMDTGFQSPGTVFNGPDQLPDYFLGRRLEWKSPISRMGVLPYFVVGAPSVFQRRSQYHPG